MKKLFLGVLIMMLLMCTTCVLADMSAPASVAFSATVSNPAGATYFDYQGTSLGSLAFGTKINCYYAWDHRVAFVLENEKFDYPEKYLKESDVTIGSLLSYKLGNKMEVIAMHNAPLYDRPNMSENDNAKVLTTIPDETPITVQEYMVDENTGALESWSRWYYSSYQGKNGWIDTEHMAAKVSNNPVYASRNIVIGSQGKTVTIPVYTELKEYYQFLGDSFHEGYVKYNGVGGYVDVDYFARKLSNEDQQYSTYEILFEGVPLFEQASVVSNKVVESIPVGTKLVGEYQADYSWFSVTYNGTKAWLYAPYELPRNMEDANNIINGYSYSPELPKNLTELSSYYAKSLGEMAQYDEKQEQPAPTPTTINNASTPVQDATSTEEVATISLPNEENLGVVEVNPNTESEVTGEAEIVETNVPVSVGSGSESNSLSPMQLVLLCVLCAFVCGVTVAVIIILVNKKK